jgi:hypothetical protein
MAELISLDMGVLACGLVILVAVASLLKDNNISAQEIL